MRVIFYTMSDGSLRIGRIYREDGSPSSGIEQRIAGGMKPNDAIRAVAEKDKPAGCISWRVGDSTELPQGHSDGRFDSSFKGAFIDEGGKVSVSMPKARDIHRDRLRQMRAPIFAQLDTDYMRADERGDIEEKRRIAARKQELRDITKDPRIEQAQTPEELKLIELK